MLTTLLLPPLNLPLNKCYYQITSDVARPTSAVLTVRVVMMGLYG